MKKAIEMTVYKKRRRYLALLVFITLCFGILWANAFTAQAKQPAQQPTVAIPTVTGSPSGPIAVVNSDQDQINVRSGPGTNYPIVGVLVSGQRVPAIGRSAGGDWVQISYPGVEGGIAWVYSFLITITGNLPIIEAPPTPTPLVTPTIDPTLAAQFVIEIAPTRLPTFTNPAPIVLPRFANSIQQENPGGIPMGLVIVGMAVVGIFGLMISLLRGR
jgi:hypothetical protein